ncbi:MAG TPA: sulfurtransferase TusA family protein [Candidatus Ornithospirochaeta avicola]|uniref:Sulfurtransferase TusA family protein n=1 Tax=Candidatus Ornithospirochaeta avicola TaxID=2840896 RepID=A0A9D1TP83_9SPIO|nr:sulfurtransferase TusA family protein [Candidatus Ornithospirochaeta avicola]
MNEYNAKGLSCPEPVIMAKKALKENKDGIDILVDNVASKENVKRYAEATGYAVEIKEEGMLWRLMIREQS